MLTKENKPSNKVVILGLFLVNPIINIVMIFNYSYVFWKVFDWHISDIIKYDTPNLAFFATIIIIKNILTGRHKTTKEGDPELLHPFADLINYVIILPAIYLYLAWILT